MTDTKMGDIERLDSEEDTYYAYKVMYTRYTNGGGFLKNAHAYFVADDADTAIALAKESADIHHIRGVEMDCDNPITMIGKSTTEVNHD